jgi:hypothetical protein
MAATAVAQKRLEARHADGSRTADRIGIAAEDPATISKGAARDIVGVRETT